MSIKVGITMRVTKANTYDEFRDSISQEWSSYIFNNFNDTQLIFIPNIEHKVIDYVNYWQIDSLIFSGGEDLGLTPKRDKTEKILFNHAQKHNIPILGICRGLQLIVSELGGSISKGSNQFVNRHKSNRHNIYFKKSILEVNSYHSNELKKNNLPTNIDVLAYDNQDDSVEAIIGKNILGLMWHPEREKATNPLETNLIKNHLGI